MKLNFHFLVIPLLLGSTLINHAYADQYKCSGQNGTISYSDRACLPGQKQLSKIVSRTLENKFSQKNNSLISMEQLQGRWTDAPGGSFNSSWYFIGLKVTYANKQGVTMIEQYTLDGNQLIFHHKPGLWGDTGWSESVTILKYTGNTLVLIWGIARVTLYRPA